MKYANKILRRWPCYLLFFIIACNVKAPGPTVSTAADSAAAMKRNIEGIRKINALKKIIKDGDVITRTGNDFTSQSLRSLNRRNKIYSHCGIAQIEKDSVFVYHALGGEWNPDEKLKRDPFELFAEPFSNNGIGIYRFDISHELKRNLGRIVTDLYKQGARFDMDFDLNTDDRLYCAEFVYKALSQASSGKLSFNHSIIGKFEFIGVDDIFLHPLCKVQATLAYK